MEVLFGAADARSQHSRETKINIKQKMPIVDLAVKGACGLPSMVEPRYGRVEPRMRRVIYVRQRERTKHVSAANSALTLRTLS